jgi:NADPH:quinone reductase-like Zn-dependent oxidoreductase
MMRAIVWTRYGPPEGLQLQEVAKPTPKNGEVLIRIHATTVTAGDCELRSLHFSIWLRLVVRVLMGLTQPRRKILGQELAGEVEAVGRDVHRFRKGDRVFGTTGFGFGAYAEYICLPEKPRAGALATKPANMSFEEAAGVPTGGLEALHFLRKVKDLSGRRILILGAGGGIGTFAVQLARYYGAEVTGVDSTGKLDLLRSIGADRVIDYTRDDFTKVGETYDVIFDVVGRSSFSDSLAVLSEDGCYLLGNPHLSTMVRALWTSMTGRKKVVFGAARQRVEDLVLLRELIEAGKIRSVIDRRYPLEQIPDAHRYFESGNARGRVVITV